MCRLPVSEFGVVERRRTSGFRSAAFGGLSDKQRVTKFTARKLLLLLFPLRVRGQEHQVMGLGPRLDFPS
jgi:hypothetical protein